MLLCELLLPNSRCTISFLAVASTPEAIELFHLLPAFFSYLRHPESMGLLFLSSTILPFPFKSLNCTSPMIFGSSPTGRSVGELAKHSHTIFWHASVSTGVTYACGNGSKPCPDLTEATGEDKYHNNISPCLSVYLWKRIS